MRFFIYEPRDDVSMEDLERVETGMSGEGTRRGCCCVLLRLPAWLRYLLIVTGVTFVLSAIVAIAVSFQEAAYEHTHPKNQMNTMTSSSHAIDSSDPLSAISTLPLSFWKLPGPDFPPVHTSTQKRGRLGYDDLNWHAWSDLWEKYIPTPYKLPKNRFPDETQAPNNEHKPPVDGKGSHLASRPAKTGSAVPSPKRNIVHVTLTTRGHRKHKGDAWSDLFGGWVSAIPPARPRLPNKPPPVPTSTPPPPPPPTDIKLPPATMTKRFYRAPRPDQSGSPEDPSPEKNVVYDTLATGATADENPAKAVESVIVGLGSVAGKILKHPYELPQEPLQETVPGTSTRAFSGVGPGASSGIAPRLTSGAAPRATSEAVQEAGWRGRAHLW